MSQRTRHRRSSKYYIPHDSLWPIIGSVALFTTDAGRRLLAQRLGRRPGRSCRASSLLAIMFFGWFRTVIGENQRGIYNLQVDRSFRMGMMWFIFSEVMFFAAFFGALFYARELSVPWLGGEGVKVFTNYLPVAALRRHGWPTNGPAHVGRTRRRHLRDHPGVRHARAEHRDPAHRAASRSPSRTTRCAPATARHAEGLPRADLPARLPVRRPPGARVRRGLHASSGLQLGTGIYGSTFFMLTGFHGLHVTHRRDHADGDLAARAARATSRPQRHFAFEAVAWYWHFVDVVWLGLFIFVYWL